MVDDPERVNQVVYAAADHVSLFDAVMARLRTLLSEEEYAAFQASRVGVAIMDAVAYGLSQNAFYLSRRASESYLSTARTPEAVYRGAIALGYKPRAATAAATDVVVSFPALAAAGKMKAPFEFRGASGEVFETVSDVALEAGDTSVALTIRQGKTRTLSFVSTGDANQSFRLASVPRDEHLVHGSVECIVDGDVWWESDLPSFAREPYFVVQYGDTPPTIRFGSGDAGMIPPAGASISVRFVTTKAVNLPAGKKTPVTQLVVAGSVVPLTVTSVKSATGARGPESLAEIKLNAPRYRASRGSAITLPDYLAHIAAWRDTYYGAVSKGTALVVRSAENDIGTTTRVDAIRTDVELCVTGVADFADAVRDALSGVSEDLTGVSDGFDDIESHLSSIVSQTAALDVVADTLTSEAATVSRLKASIQEEVDTIQAEIAGAGNLGVIGASAAAIETALGSLGVSAATLGSQASSVATSVATVTTASVGIVEIAETGRDTVDADVETVAGVLVIVSEITDLVDSTNELVLSDSSELLRYLSELFSHDCKANVVSVPVLSQDADGFYVAPSVGLMRRLEVALQSIADVTHLVRVVSGGSSLVPADVEFRFKVAPTASPSAVRSSLIALTDDVLRGREYGARLNVSDITNRVRDEVSGLDWFNVTISADEEYMDFGNLVPGPARIVTRGTVTLVEEE